MSKRSVGVAGFTLLEVLIVVAIIIAMTAISIPNIMSYLRTYRIRGASQQVAGAIQEARLKAITKSSNWGTIFVIQDARTYWVHSEDLQTPNGPPADRRALIAGACVPGGGGVLDRQCLDMTAATVRSQSTRYVLPDRVVFAPAAQCLTTPPLVPPFAPNDFELRFNRLGSICDPGATATCPVILLPAAGNFIDNQQTGSTVCLSLTDGSFAANPTGIARSITITRGGRVMEQR